MASAAWVVAKVRAGECAVCDTFWIANSHREGMREHRGSKQHTNLLLTPVFAQLRERARESGAVCSHSEPLAQSFNKNHGHIYTALFLLCCRYGTMEEDVAALARARARRGWNYKINRVNIKLCTSAPCAGAHIKGQYLPSRHLIQEIKTLYTRPRPVLCCYCYTPRSTARCVLYPVYN